MGRIIGRGIWEMLSDLERVRSTCDLGRSKIVTSYELDARYQDSKFWNVPADHTDR